jgi:hypothetical protein
MRKFFEIGGVVAAAILIAFGTTSIVWASTDATRRTRTWARS